ncbi:MAG: ATP phosphoribosyltransferase [Candidatus Lokiarchaeota archaeon]|nr:ATP phosphoribosyltransferase [Candidatus Lokiarchaeota archaeon]
MNDSELEIKLLRPQEIPNYLTYEDGFDLGISGLDWVKETGADVERVLSLDAGKVRIVFCIPNTWQNINSLDDFINIFHEKGKVLRISTEYINLSIKSIMKCPSYKQYYQEQIPKVITPWKTWGTNDNVKIYLSFGATEAKPPEEVDAIIDNTETGSTIRANNLKIIEVLDRSGGILIANKKSLEDEWKREKIEDIKILLSGVRNARKKIHLFMNVKEENLNALIDVLPALKKPTVAKLAGKDSDGWLAVNTIIDKEKFIDLIPKLRKLAQGIVVHEPRQVIET